MNEQAVIRVVGAGAREAVATVHLHHGPATGDAAGLRILSEVSESLAETMGRRRASEALYTLADKLVGRDVNLANAPVGLPVSLMVVEARPAPPPEAADGSDAPAPVRRRTRPRLARDHGRGRAQGRTLAGRGRRRDSHDAGDPHGSGAGRTDTLTRGRNPCRTTVSWLAAGAD